MNNTVSTMIPLDPTKYDGCIFDCDGTLADTMPLHYRAWNETLTKKLGPNLKFNHRPDHEGRRFSAKALIPSTRSSDWKTLMSASRSYRRPSVRLLS